MSTVRQHQLELEERDALCDLTSVLIRVASLRLSQLREVRRELDLSEKSAQVSEGACERLCEEVAKLTGDKISTYDRGVTVALTEIRRLRHELDQHQRAMKEAGVQLPEEMPF
jgi:hypothetical protein